VWARAAAWRAGAPPPVAPIDLQDVEIVRISNPRFNILAEDLPMIGAPRMPA
jgi:hypothetical protein